MRKQELNIKYGKMIKQKLSSAYGKCVIYIDTDSIKNTPTDIVCRDNALCMYDYAKEIYEVLDE